MVFVNSWGPSSREIAAGVDMALGRSLVTVTTSCIMTGCTRRGGCTEGQICELFVGRALDKETHNAINNSQALW